MFPLRKRQKEEHIEHMETQRNLSADMLKKALREMEEALKEIEEKKKKCQE